jgi:hypothetical protein
MVKGTKTTAELAKSLAGAKSRHVPWTDVARSVRDGMQEIRLTQGAQAVGRFQKEAAAGSGYSVGALKRFLARLEFLDKLPDGHRPPPEIANSAFTAIEIIERICRHDVQKGRELLLRLNKGKTIVVSELRKILNNLTKSTPPMTSGPVLMAHHYSYAAAERHSRKADAFEKLRQLLPELSGKIELFSKPIGTSPPAIRCDAIAWLDNELTQGDGFEIAYAAHGTGIAAISDLLSRAVVASSLFRRHYLVFTEGSSSTLAARVIESLKVLQANSIGVVMLEESGHQILRKPKGPPVPDRRKMLRTICPGGRWA